MLRYLLFTGLIVGNCLQHKHLLAAANPELVTPPSSINVTILTNASFECAVSGGPLYWLVNGSMYSKSQLRQRGIVFSVTQASGIQRSTLYVYATASNNNSRIQCGVFRTMSAPATLKIQGLLSAPIPVPLEENSTTYKFIHFRWTTPFTLDITNVSPDIAHYVVTIANINTGEVVIKNTTMNGYNFTREDYVHCDRFSFQVAAVNGAGVSNRSEGIVASFAGPTINSSPLNTSTTTKTFECSLSCSNVLNLATEWFVNEKLVKSFDPTSYSKQTDYHSCTLPGAENFTETLEILSPSSFTSDVNAMLVVYCGALVLTSKTEMDSTEGSQNVCYSRNAYLKVSLSLNESEGTIASSENVNSLSTLLWALSTTTSTTKTLTVSSNDDVSSVFQEQQKSWPILGTCIGLAAMLFAVVVLFIGVLVCMLLKRNKGNRKSNLKDETYAIPFSTHTGSKSDHSEVIYDQPKTPSPQPDLEPCPAYQTKTELQRCPAYHTITQH